MGNRGQIQSYIIIVAMAAIITMLLVYFGFQAWKSMGSKTAEIQSLKFEADFTNAIAEIERRSGSVEREFELPDGYSRICFLDPSRSQLHFPDPPNPLFVQFAEEQKNVFLEGDSMPLGYRTNQIKTDVDDRWPCFEATDGLVRFRMSGGGMSGGVVRLEQISYAS
ncbi:hypothetical protein JXB02_03980 [Candidatus Woesearchaeota archaeon]|nr:hypothetical protein [Candidatus Woesearchaeota archaeon]